MIFIWKSTWHDPESFGKMDPQFRKCPLQTGFGSRPVVHFLDWLLMWDGTLWMMSPWAGDTGSYKKAGWASQEEQATEQHSYGKTPLPAMTSFNDWCYILGLDVGSQGSVERSTEAPQKLMLAFPRCRGGDWFPRCRGDRAGPP